jgi:alpha-glucosidase (family GH31 glycosyl hydrolase)
MPVDMGIERGPLSVEITLEPFVFSLERDGRPLLAEAGVWAAEGTFDDQFVLFTEGVIHREQLAPMQRAASAEVLSARESSLTLRLELADRRSATLTVSLAQPERLSLDIDVARAPLRLALDWRRRQDECFVGLGARHGTRLDHAGRSIVLGADRRYTGPDCPDEMLALGGIPQGDCAPMPYFCSSGGYSVWAVSDANGARFDFSGERTSVSTRAHAGPLRLEIFCACTPAARLRAFCRQTGFPALAPEWGYGFWKSRDIYEHQDDVLEDLGALRAHGIALDAIVIDSPWATQYNTWEFNPHQFPDARGMIAHLRENGVRTVVWCTPWVNLDSRDGQIAPQPQSERMYSRPASNYARGADAGHFVRDATGRPLVSQWWMGSGSIVDFTSPAATRWWQAQVQRVLALGVEGVKMDDGDGYYIPPDARLADGRAGASAAWALGGLHRAALQRSLDEVHPGRGVIFGRSCWSGQQATGFTWAGDQASDFWSLRALVVASLSAAASGISNWSHDVGGYLGYRLVQRCPPELLIRWVQFGCFTPLMHAHSRLPQEPWLYGGRVLDLYRAYVLLHEQLVPYVRAAAATAARTGLPIIRPLCLIDPGDARGWEITDAYGYGPAMWVAPVLHDGAREREVPLPRGDWLQTWDGVRVRGGRELAVPAPLQQIPVFVRAGSIIVSHPAEHVATGLGDVPESRRPLEATLWGKPPLARASSRLADGTTVRWRQRSGWSCSDPTRLVDARVIDG